MQFIACNIEFIVDMVAELSDEPLTYQVHVVPNQDGENNFGALCCFAVGLWLVFGGVCS